MVKEDLSFAIESVPAKGRGLVALIDMEEGSCILIRIIFESQAVVCFHSYLSIHRIHCALGNASCLGSRDQHDFIDVQSLFEDAGPKLSM